MSPLEGRIGFVAFVGGWLWLTYIAVGESWQLLPIGMMGVVAAVILFDIAKETKR